MLLIAHLDGYGYGTPFKGDGLYNGTLDDAAYVSTLITFAGPGRARVPPTGRLRRRDRRGKGPVGFALARGTSHPAAPRPVAVMNLDQLRPLYPLTILTTLALDDSTLGQAVRDVAGRMGSAVRGDLEPERNLLRRRDHWPFMQIGVPAVSFLFGFDASDAQAAAAYRDWYENRYHAPQDDMSTPIDFQAHTYFHGFFFALVEAVANSDAPPAWLPGSSNRPNSK